MYYGLITFSALLFSLQFFFNERFQKEAGSGFKQSILFAFYNALFGAIMLLLMNSFKLQITVFSLVIAFIYGIVNVSMSYCAIKAFSYANLSTFSVFSMIGGMLLPFIFGVCIGESFTFLKGLCCLLLILAICFQKPSNKNAISKHAFLFYIGIFVFNGTVGVLSTIHQLNQNFAVDSTSFTMLTKLTTLVICIIVMLYDHIVPKVNLKGLWFAGGHSVLNTIGNYFLLIALLHLSASVQYPMVTGGVMLFSFLIDTIMNKRWILRDFISVFIACIASILMAL